MIRAHYPELFRRQPEQLNEITRLAQRTYELTDFLLNVAKIDGISANFPDHVTYHDSCSGLRELGGSDAAARLAGHGAGAESG